MVGAADSHPHIKAVILPLSQRPTRAGTQLASYRFATSWVRPLHRPSLCSGM